MPTREEIREWSSKRKYNPFNSDKGLTYYTNYKQILAWLDGDKYLPPPIEVNLDPVIGCNLNCYFCITQSYMKGVKHEQLPLEYMMGLVDFLADWGVRGLCISGGGEPTLHLDLSDVIGHANMKKMDVALVTNAVKIPIEGLSCRWMALSVDASTRDTYKKIKGKDEFKSVCDNILILSDVRKGLERETDLCFKFLILPENQYEIYDACKLAKELGVQDFHARPCDFEKQDIVGHKKLTLDIVAIHEQFDRCHTLEDENFHVYTITHKFSPEFHVTHDYPACLAAPLILPVLTDGNAYLCVEHKMDPKYLLGAAYPNPEKILDWWGSDRHRQMIKGIVPERDCSRCIYSGYHQQIEAIRTDSMSLSFP